MKRIFLLLSGIVILKIAGCGGCQNEALSKATPFFQKGLELEKQGHFSSAAEQYRLAIETYPDYVEAQFQLGNLYEKLGIPGEAQRQYEKTIELNSRHSDAYNNLGNVLGQQGQLDQAIEAYQKAVEYNETLAPAHFNLGHSLLLKRQLPEAEKELKRAVELSSDPRYALALGRLYATQGRFEEAIPYLEKAHRDNRDDKEAYYPLADAYEKTKRYDEAIAILLTYSELTTDFEEKMIVRSRIRDLKMQKTDERRLAQKRRLSR